MEATKQKIEVDCIKEIINKRNKRKLNETERRNMSRERRNIKKERRTSLTERRNIKKERRTSLTERRNKKKEKKIVQQDNYMLKNIVERKGEY